MAQKFHRRMASLARHPSPPEDARYHALYQALIARVVAAISGYSDLRLTFARQHDALQKTPDDTRLQAERAHTFCQLHEARGRALAYLDTFTLAFPDSHQDDHANLERARQIAGLDALPLAVAQVLQSGVPAAEGGA